MFQTLTDLFCLLAHAPQREVTAKTLTAEVGHCLYFKDKELMSYFLMKENGKSKYTFDI